MKVGDLIRILHNVHKEAEVKLWRERVGEDGRLEIVLEDLKALGVFKQLPKRYLIIS